MTRPSWLPPLRTWLAFLLAPLAVPLIWVAVIAANATPGPTRWDYALQTLAVVFCVSAVYTYAGVIVFGIPMYVTLREQRITSFWIAPIFGYVVGAIMLSMFGAVASLVVGGLLGALVGTILWLIDRPDRQPPRSRANIIDGVRPHSGQPHLPVRRAPMSAVWESLRGAIAFLAAPAVVPLIVAGYLAIDLGAHGSFPDSALSGARAVVLVAALFSYGGVFLFGVPIYLFLRSRNQTEFWIAPVVGFIVGALMTMIVPLTPLALGGPLGALVGATLWLIDRPDRQVKDGSA